jgi:hypothetical protein
MNQSKQGLGFGSCGFADLAGDPDTASSTNDMTPPSSGAAAAVKLRPSTAIARTIDDEILAAFQQGAHICDLRDRSSSPRF